MDIREKQRTYYISAFASQLSPSGTQDCETVASFSAGKYHRAFASAADKVALREKILAIHKNTNGPQAFWEKIKQHGLPENDVRSILKELDQEQNNPTYKRNHPILFDDLVEKNRPLAAPNAHHGKDPNTPGDSTLIEKQNKDKALPTQRISPAKKGQRLGREKLTEELRLKGIDENIVRQIDDVFKAHAIFANSREVINERW